MERAVVELWQSLDVPASGVALACVGSLARRELGPRSDIDLVLLHDGRTRGVDGLAEQLWYPIWDARIKLDHSVRTPAECAQIAGSELSAGIGLLDLRPLAGDLDLAANARTSLLSSWRNGARRRLPELLDSITERRATFGNAAYLLEPDLKEARGGFRDMSMLRALAATWLTDLPHTGVQAPYDKLLDVRDALHVVSGRALDRLLATEIGEVATRLGYPEADALHRHVSLAARRIGYAVDLTARSARQVVPVRRVISFARRERKPAIVAGPHGLIIHAGEVGLAKESSAQDALTGLRAGAFAAQQGLMLSPVTAQNLGLAGARLPVPWPPAARQALLELLSAGPALLGVWEALELNGCIRRWLPEWETIRAKPQHNPIHRHTVDRHSVQTVVEAQPFLTQVDRPDLLVLAALFHDIGKGVSGPDHAVVGAPIARRVMIELGLDDTDADLVALLVREHLTLPDLATRRDHTDPATLDALVAAVDGRAEVLKLLRALTECDARAAGPAAWSPWRAKLIDALAAQAMSRLVGEERQPPADTRAGLELADQVRTDGRPRIRVDAVPDGTQMTIAQSDRVGLFADTAGLLAANLVTVRSGLLTTTGGIAVNTWLIETRSPEDLPDKAYLIGQLERLAAEDSLALEPVRRREARAQRGSGQKADRGAGRGAGSAPMVQAVPDASESAVVAEIRAGDRSGLLWALGDAVASMGLTIRSAQLATLAGQAVDTLYLTEPDGARPDPDRAAAAILALRAAAEVSGPA